MCMFDFKQGPLRINFYRFCEIAPSFSGLEDNEILSVLNCVNAALISKQQGSYIFRTETLPR